MDERANIIIYARISYHLLFAQLIVLMRHTPWLLVRVDIASRDASGHTGRRRSSSASRTRAVMDTTPSAGHQCATFSYEGMRQRYHEIAGGYMTPDDYYHFSDARALIGRR